MSTPSPNFNKSLYDMNIVFHYLAGFPNFNEPLFDMNQVFAGLVESAEHAKKGDDSSFNKLLSEIQAFKNSSSEPDLLKGQIRKLLESGDISAPGLQKFCAEVPN